MSEEDVVTNEEDIQADESDDQGDNNGQEDLGSVEDQARRMGWKPKEEFKGKGDWVDAEEFVQKAQEDPVAIRKANQILERKMMRMEKSIDLMLEHHERDAKSREEEAYNRAMSDLKRQIDSAVEDGDVEKANRAIKAREEMIAQKKSETSTQQQSRMNPDDDSLVQDWISKNDWFKNDPVMNDYAVKYEHILAGQGLDLEERLKKTEEYVRGHFPHKFGQQQGRQKPMAHLPVNGGSNSSLARKPAVKPGSYEDLTPEARAACDRVVSMTGGKITKEAWIEKAMDSMFMSKKGK